jgi:hypothetical protein
MLRLAESAPDCAMTQKPLRSPWRNCKPCSPPGPAPATPANAPTRTRPNNALLGPCPGLKGGTLPGQGRPDRMPSGSPPRSGPLVGVRLLDADAIDATAQREQHTKHRPGEMRGHVTSRGGGARLALPVAAILLTAPTSAAWSPCSPSGPAAGCAHGRCLCPRHRRRHRHRRRPWRSRCGWSSPA